jgi:hypothetical protein
VTLHAVAMHTSRRNEDECLGHDWFDAMLESIADAVIATDQSGAIAAMNSPR